MAKKTLAILDDYQGVALNMADWSVLKDRCEIVVYHDHIPDADEVVARLKHTNIICIMRERTPFPREVLERLPNLEMIASNAPGNAAVDVEAAAKLGIHVSHTGWTGYGTAELTWGLILSAFLNLPKEIASFKSGGWQRHVSRDFNGRTLGIVGLGNIGQSVARIGQAFGMNVIAWSPHLTPERAAPHNVKAVSKAELFSTSDVISVHMKLTDATKGLVGQAEIDAMKDDAWLINAARGPLVDETALIAALENGKIGGAGVDTYDIEPLPQDHPFRILPNVVATPHIGFVTEDTYRMFYGEMVEAIADWLDKA